MNTFHKSMKLIMNKAFCWGVLIASVTWIITIVLYTKISSLSTIFSASGSTDRSHSATTNARAEKIAEDMHLNPVFPTIQSE